MAVVVERIVAAIILDKAQGKAAQDLRILEATRSATSALFEFALWNQPQLAEDLFQQYYGVWDIDTLPAGVWAADSFRSIDPVYNHNYVLAARVADRTIEFLQDKFDDNHIEWGHWLAVNYYADGRRRSLEDKTAVIGGLV